MKEVLPRAICLFVDYVSLSRPRLLSLAHDGRDIALLHVQNIFIPCGRLPIAPDASERSYGVTTDPNEKKRKR